MTLTIPEILRCKRDGEEWSEEEVLYFINAVKDGNIDKSQIGASLMAIYLKGLTQKETVCMTKAMMMSGSVQKWNPDWKVVDKHSTGGVGDKVTFPLVAAVATFGLKMPMISGRGLGHTGGTADKLESIPGFKIALTDEGMLTTLDTVGAYITCQNGNIAPADKILYSTRDITSTVSCHPLICSSIMSKKLAEGLNTLVLDVKVGIGAVTGTYEQAEWLAQTMVGIGNSLGVKTTAVLTEMDTPIGYAIGNALEIIESFECIRGNGPEDLEKLCAVQGAVLLVKSGVATTQKEGEKMIRQTFHDGTALTKFCHVLSNQGVSAATIADLKEGRYNEVFTKATVVEEIRAEESGYISSIDSMALARVVVLLGGGRQFPDDLIDFSVGLKLRKTKGDKICAGDVWLEVHHNDNLTNNMSKALEGAISVGKEGSSIERIIGVIEDKMPTAKYVS